MVSNEERFASISWEGDSWKVLKSWPKPMQVSLVAGAAMGQRAGLQTIGAGLADVALHLHAFGAGEFGGDAFFSDSVRGRIRVRQPI